MKSLIWFRRDLRIHDNPALHHAINKSDKVVALAFSNPGQWKKHCDAPAKIGFWQANLSELAIELANLGIEIALLQVDNFAQVPDAILKFAKESLCDSIFFNKEYEVNEQQRDKKVERLLKANNISLHSFDDRVIIAPGRILTGSGGPYTVFTPFRRSWLGLAQNADLSPLPAPEKSFGTKFIPPEFKQQKVQKWRADLWPAGEKAAQKKLEFFIENQVNNYHQQRDFPDIDGTSMLSPYLAAGVLSPRQCLRKLIKVFGKLPGEKQPGAETWLSEIIWREFYTHVLSAFPRVSKSQPFKQKMSAIKWNSDEKLLNAWKNGNTGYPIVDAAMRQLKQTGWMHNRLRMVSAMFLCKHLLIDWREGEKFFMQNLVDGDLAANNGGWQWSASTGTDAVPYFRIFNPFSQSLRFDKEGCFIKKFCPELSVVQASSLHDAQKLAKEIENHKIDYARQIVDHKEARQRALNAFKESA